MTKARPLANTRKAFASKGDDVTLTRFVAVNPGVLGKPQPPLPPTNAAIIDARSKFPKAVRHPSAGGVLKTGHNSVKLGRDVRKGDLKGYWIYSLSLEERKTCPETCAHWFNCYGNNMPFAERTIHGPAMLDMLRSEIPALLGIRGRKGILIRLHGLGDFYSTEYVEFWREMLDTYKNLAVFGYTARHREPIGVAIQMLRMKFGLRFAIRFSDAPLFTNATVSLTDPKKCPDNAFVCPEQLGKTKACATCGLCWSTDKNVAFIGH